MKIYSLLLILTIASLVAVQAGPGAYEPDKLRVYLRMDKKFFYADEDVVLYICVKNTSENNNYFDIYDASDAESGKYVSFQPLVFDASGREAEITVPYVIGKRDINDLIRGLDKRVVELAPGETFIHSVNLKDIYKLNLNTMYRLKSLFYPAFTNGSIIKSDNELSFKIREEKRYNKPSGVEAVVRNISPAEVILLTLNAEKNKNWDGFIKYINIEKYINAYPEFVQRYLRANFEEKYQIEREFVKYLTRERDDYLLDYKIMKEEIENSNKIAYVDVIADRFGVQLTNRFKYRYTLEQYKSMWLIIDQEATIMKGARR